MWKLSGTCSLDTFGETMEIFIIRNFSSHLQPMVFQLPSNLRILGKSSERRNELKDGRENSDRENERIHNEFDVK